MSDNVEVYVHKDTNLDERAPTHELYAVKCHRRLPLPYEGYTAQLLRLAKSKETRESPVSPTFSIFVENAKILL